MYILDTDLTSNTRFEHSFYHYISLRLGEFFCLILFWEGVVFVSAFFFFFFEIMFPTARAGLRLTT